MNRFIVDNLPHRIAEALCDQHIVKMPLEEAQMLCTALWHHAPSYAVQHSLYKPAHQKHPCTLWSQATRANYLWAVSLYIHMLREYSYRFGKQHGAAKHEVAIINGMMHIPEGPYTRPPQCFGTHESCKTNEFWPVNAYRSFYRADKASFARWTKNRQAPKWWSNDCDKIATLDDKYSFVI